MFKDQNVLKYYKRFAWLLLIGVLADILVDFMQLYIPEFLGNVVQIVGYKANPVFEDIADIIRKIIIVAFALFFGRIVMRFTILYSSTKIQANMRHDMFEKAERLSQRYYHQNKIGNIMSWFSSDLEAIEEFTGWGTIMIVDALFLSSMAIIKMWKLDYVLTLVSLIPMLTLIIWGFLVEKTMVERWEDRQKNFDHLYDFTQENFSGIRVIKAFVKENQEILAFNKIAKQNAEKNLAFAKAAIRFDVSIELIIGIIVSIIMSLGAYFVYCYVGGHPYVIFGHTVSLSAGGLVAFLGYCDILIWPMIAMGQIVQMYSRASASLKRVSNFLNQDEEIRNKENAVVLDKCEGNIKFDNFSFAYPDSSIHSLENISLEIKAGEMIGVVGKIGSGKTTLLNSLLRLYNIDEKQIFIDGHDIMDLDIKSLRDNIAYVPQDNFLFSDNVFNNIAFANKDLGLKDIRNAARFAAVDDNIIGFPKGYETLTGERGVSLSGGQKQRISIARAYIKDAPIMIMDDSVSSVDVKTEETILENIHNKRKGKTTIIIASRISTVAHLDKIIVLNNGKLEAFDTPENLLKTSPTYQKMHYLQQLEAEL